MTRTTSINGMDVVNRGAASSPTVLITGVSKGLGRALALELARRGHFVIGCSRSQDKLNSLQSELSSPSASSDSNSSSSDKHLLLNVSSNSSVEELARVVKERKGVPDIIVNNAGTISRNKKIWEVTVEEFDTVMDTNVKGTANVLQSFHPSDDCKEARNHCQYVFWMAKIWCCTGCTLSCIKMGL